MRGPQCRGQQESPDPEGTSVGPLTDGLLLLVDSVDAAVESPEMPEGVVHLRDARHLAEQLTTSSLQLGGRAVDIVDSETEDETIVKPLGRDGIGCVEIEKCAVRHREHRPTRPLHCRG